MSQDTREKIMNAGKILFSASGYAAVTTKEIAKNAGISEVTLYRYFDTKRSLFNSIIKENMMNFGIASYIENDVTYNVRQDLTEISRLMIESYKQNGALIQMVMKDSFLKSDAKTHYKHIENRDIKVLRSYFQTIKEKGLVKDDAEKLMRFFVSNLHGFAIKNFIFKHKPVNEETNEYLDWLKNKLIDTILM